MKRLFLALLTLLVVLPAAAMLFSSQPTLAACTSTVDSQGVPTDYCGVDPNAGKCVYQDAATAKYLDTPCAGYTVKGKVFVPQSGKCYIVVQGPDAAHTASITPIDCAQYTSLVNNSTDCPALATLKINCSKNKNPIYALLEYAINFAVRLLIVLAVVAVVISGIQYIVSQGNPEGIKAAKSRLTNAVVGLILLSLMFVILNVLGV